MSARLAVRGMTKGGDRRTVSFHRVHTVGRGSLAASHVVWEAPATLSRLWGSFRVCLLWTPCSPPAPPVIRPMEGNI